MALIRSPETLFSCKMPFVVEIRFQKKMGLEVSISPLCSFGIMILIHFNVLRDFSSEIGFNVHSFCTLVTTGFIFSPLDRLIEQDNWLDWHSNQLSDVYCMYPWPASIQLDNTKILLSEENIKKRWLKEASFDTKRKRNWWMWHVLIS